MFFMLRNGTPFSDRKVVKDSKVKARYHHLIAHSFVEVGLGKRSKGLIGSLKELYHKIY